MLKATKNGGKLMAKSPLTRSHALQRRETIISYLFLLLWGTFAGIFVGSLAMAIAEMLDTIPIFARRIALRHGLGIIVSSMAAGKLAGSLFYFYTGMDMFGG